MSDADTNVPADAEATSETASDTLALPGDGLRDGIVEALRATLGDQLVDVHLIPQTDLWVRVATDAWAAAGAALKAQGFDYFCFLSAIDWMPSPYGKNESDPFETSLTPNAGAPIVPGFTGGDTRFQMIARVYDTRRHVGVTVKTDVPDDTMTVMTWIPSFAGANWHEREAHEMFGLNFAGHPDLRKLYLPGDFEGFPLRKDFPLLARMIKPWPGIVDVEPMPMSEDDAAAEADGATTDEAAS